jgi:hypothetical protein
VYPVLRQVLELEPLRARLAACRAGVDARALARAGLAIARRQAIRARPYVAAFLTSLLAALMAGVRSRLRAFGAAADPLLRLFVGEVHAVMLRVCVYGCALGAMGLLAAEFITLPRGSVVAEATPETEWVEINRPFPVFAMSMPDFDEAPRYASWRHASGRGRKDILTFGDLTASGATAVVELYRPGSEPGNEPEEITASVPELRLSGRPVLPTTIETKFGAIAVDPFRDRAPNGERRCLRFARNFDEPRFEISGWYCNAGQELVDRGMLACALDRLTLIAAGGEPKIGALFAQAELKRTFCGANNVFLAATPKRNDWIEAERDPRLRGRQ